MDLLTAICYILVISTSIAFEYTANLWLMDLWLVSRVKIIRKINL